MSHQLSRVFESRCPHFMDSCQRTHNTPIYQWQPKGRPRRGFHSLRADGTRFSTPHSVLRKRQGNRVAGWWRYGIGSDSRLAWVAARKGDETM